MFKLGGSFCQTSNKSTEFNLIQTTQIQIQQNLYLIINFIAHFSKNYLNQRISDSLQNNKKVDLTSMNYGIEAIEFYAPKTYVDQSDLEKHYGVSQGKYTKGLGQLQLSFATQSEDVNSLALSAVNNLMKNNNIHPSQVGRLEVGTETMIDKSKSTKTVLMSLFKGFNDIQGATSINACYGATNALLNTLNWISSPNWDGRYGIVVAVDIAVYEEGPARPTGGAGAVAMLIGKNAKIIINPFRSSFIDNQWDFYKPIPSSEYPTVDGKYSMDLYLKALKECYLKLKQKNKGNSPVEGMNYFCFHSPFAKMVQKAFTSLLKNDNPLISPEQIDKKFTTQVEQSLFLGKRYGNIYNGSLYLCLLSLLLTTSDINNKNVLMFSYGSGVCSTMFQIRIRENIISASQKNRIEKMLGERVRVSAADFTKIMLQKQISYGKFRGVITPVQNLLDQGAFYLSEIDSKWRRFYKQKQNKEPALLKSDISYIKRIPGLDARINNKDIDASKFYKQSIEGRRISIEDTTGFPLDHELLNSGGISTQNANSMIQNVIGKLSLPLAVVPSLKINNKQYAVPMCIEEPSVVAAVSSIAKLLAPFGIKATSTQSQMLGQVHLPQLDPMNRYQLEKKEKEIMRMLNQENKSMVARGGGVKSVTLRELAPDNKGKRGYSLDIVINVCDAMGANITNTIAEKAKQILSHMGLKTGISILSNYCLKRRAVASFKLPITALEWKGVAGQDVAAKIIEAYQFAKSDKFRAVTHNKGIMNGVDAVCMATGQDWRAVESAAHAFAAEGNLQQNYRPLTHYQIVEEKGVKYFVGMLELPMAVGVVGGSVNKNPLYGTCLGLMGNPSSQELAEVITSVGLCQNMAALRALAIQGIQKGHMRLHARALAVKGGVPAHLLDDCCKFMEMSKKYDNDTIQKFLDLITKPKL